MSEQIRTFVFMGRPGSGKGTQATLLAKHLQCRYFATGDEFRRLSTIDSPVGRRTKETIDTGHLMPHWFASHLVHETLFSLREDDYVVFDGTNRTLPEAQLFYEVATWIQRSYRVIYLEASVESITNRILARARESGRADDTLERVQVRIAEYDSNTAHALAFLEEKQLVTRLPGEKSVEEIHAQIRSIVAEL